MNNKFFQISARHMRTICGIEEARIFPVTRVENNMIGGRGYDTFVFLDTGDGYYKGEYVGKQSMFAGRGKFVDESEYLAQCDAEMPAVGSYKTGTVRNGRPVIAFSYSIGKQTMMSLPARLNGGRIPDLDECADILSGDEVRAACARFNGERFNAGPRVDLSKPDVPAHVASVATYPQESNAVLLERTRATLAERRTTTASVFDRMQERRRATVPAVVDDGEPGDPCPGCAACLHVGQDMCDDCRQTAPQVRNLYMCAVCEHEWSDIWTEATNEQCPSCGIANVEPYDIEATD